jgi:hypothetical protein
MELEERRRAEQRIDALLPELAATMLAWENRNRENWRDSNREARRLRVLMQSISGYANDIAAHDGRAYYWGVNARRG